MMKKMQLSRYKAALVAVASVALLTQAVLAATITPQMGDLILGFRATANPGQTVNLEVDLGPVSRFYNATSGQVIALPELSTADISAQYGAGWITRTDLYWGAVATTGRAAGTPDSHAPVDTLWATAPNCATAFLRKSSSAQGNASATIEAMIVAGSAGTLMGATSTANSTNAAVFADSSVAGTWSKQESKTAGVSFGFFSPTVDNYEGTNIVVSQLYELQPTSSAGVKGTYLGDLILTASGLSFKAASPIALVCSNLTVQTDTNCTATVTAEQVGSQSTGYCLNLSIDASGPLSVGTTNVNLIGVDGSGASSTCTATVVVQAAAPTIASKANITTNLASGCSAVVTYTTPVATGCGAPGAVNCVPTSGTSFSTGTNTVTCSVTDTLDSQTGSSSFKVIVVSSAAPTLASHADVSNSVASCTAPTVTYTAPVASGCNTPGTVVCTPASGTTFQFGSTPVSCTVTDAAGRGASSSFNVVVTSTAAPTLASHADVSNSVSSCTAPTVSYTAPVASGCNTPGTVVCTPASGTTFAIGTTSVSCTVSDAANRTATSSFNVVVTSTAAPTLSGTPANISTNVASASATSLVVTYTAPTASGCNTPGAVTCVPASGFAFPVGSTNVVCTVTDAALRTGSSSFTVTVSGQGINGVKTIVQGFTPTTDPKLGTARLNSLLTSLTIAAADMNKYKTNAHTHVITTNVTAACAQLNAELIKAKVYFQMHLLSTNSYSALTNAVAAQQTAIGCKK